MKYFLDTNICIYFLKGQHPNLIKNLQKQTPTGIKIPAIVKAELLYGAKKSEKVHANTEKINNFLYPFEIIAFDDSCTGYYSNLRSKLELKGCTIGPNDLIIASIVMSHNGILVTNNTKEFSRIAHLKLEDWTN